MKYISAESVGKIEIGIYRNLEEKIGRIITVDKYFNTFVPAYKEMIDNLRIIRNHDYEKFKQEKVNNLACATFSCICGENKSIVQRRNDLMVIDIDLKDNPEAENIDLHIWKEALMLYPFVYAVNYSCSGKGLYAIIITENKDDKQFISHFKAIKYKLFNELGIVIDGNCGNVNRLRFLSYDDFPMIKKDCMLEYFEEEYVEPEIEKYEPVFKYTGDISLVNDDELVYYTIKKLIDDKFYQTFSYKDWLVEAYRLAPLGEMGKQLFIEMSQFSDGYTGDNDCVKQFNKCYEKSKFSREDCVLHFYHIAKTIYGDDWKDIVREKINTII